MRDRGTTRAVLASSNFPPVRGGSASVYANLAAQSGGRVLVLAAQTDYTDGLALTGWREHDMHAPYEVLRLPLIRTTIRRPGSRRSTVALIAADLAIRTRVLATILRLAATSNVRTVCVGELMAGGWMLHALRRVPGMRTVAYVHGEEITTDADRHGEQAKMRASLLAADRIVVVSRFTLAATTALIGCENAGRITLIQNGVDTTRFVPGPKPAELERRYGLEGRFVFVTVCRLVAKKGVDRTIEAFARIAARDPDCRLLIVGSGPQAEELAELRHRLGLTDRVTFAGAVSERELIAHYQAGDVFVMPNRAMPDGDTEGFGLVFLEANGCGLPVVAGRDGGSVEAVEHGHNGLVVDGNSVDAIEGAMMALKEDAGLRREIRERGLRRARESDWSSRAATFGEVCFGASQAEGPPRP